VIVFPAFPLRLSPAGACDDFTLLASSTSGFKASLCRFLSTWLKEEKKPAETLLNARSDS
jgi:hypothetical protein